MQTNAFAYSQRLQSSLQHRVGSTLNIMYNQIQSHVIIHFSYYIPIRSQCELILRLHIQKLVAYRAAEEETVLIINILVDH